jgi:hypothetical protein
MVMLYKVSQLEEKERSSVCLLLLNIIDSLILDHRSIGPFGPMYLCCLCCFMGVGG